MARFIIKQFKVFYSIVSFNAIDMMYSFSRIKVSTQVFFHHKAVFKNIFMFFVCMGMIVFFDKDVSGMVYLFATFPVDTIFSSMCFSYFFFCFFGMMFSQHKRRWIFSASNTHLSFRFLGVYISKFCHCTCPLIFDSIIYEKVFGVNKNKEVYCV